MQRVAGLVLVVFLMLASCSAGDGGEETNERAQASEAQSVTSQFTLDLSPAAAERLREIEARGVLLVAISNEESIYEVTPSGSIVGVHYNLVRRIAGMLDLAVEFTPVEFSSFFEIDGAVPPQVRTDPSFGYTPDLLREVDFYAVAMSPLAWREKLFSFVPLYPSRLVLVSPRSEQRVDPDSLSGARFATIENTTYEQWARDSLDTDSVQLAFFATGEELLEAVSTGEADATVADANLVLAQLRAYPDLEMYPAGGEIEMLSWATAKDDPIAEVLEQVLDHLRATGEFNELWSEYYGSSFMNYLRVLSAE